MTLDSFLLTGQVAVIAAFVTSFGIIISAFISSSRQMRAALANANVAYQALEHNRSESESKRVAEATQIFRAAVLSVSEKELEHIQNTRNVAVELLILLRTWEAESASKDDNVKRLLTLAETLCFLIPPNTPLGEQVNIDAMKIYVLADCGEEPWKMDKAFISRFKMNLLLATAAEEGRVRKQMLDGEYIKSKLEPYTYRQPSHEA